MGGVAFARCTRAFTNCLDLSQVVYCYHECTGHTTLVKFINNLTCPGTFMGRCFSSSSVSLSVSLSTEGLSSSLMGGGEIVAVVVWEEKVMVVVMVAVLAAHDDDGGSGDGGGGARMAVMMSHKWSNGTHIGSGRSRWR